MSDLTELVGKYLQIWNEPDAEQRDKAIAEVFAEDCSYTDPLAAVQGRAGVAAVIFGAREQFPGFSFTLRGDVDVHHDIARFVWDLVPAGGGEAPVVGFDVAVADAAGRIRNVYGFLDRVPAA